ncbi:putative serine/threonine protein phosphatase [Sarracenia purpurea var. burkii]
MPVVTSVSPAHEPKTGCAISATSAAGSSSISNKSLPRNFGATGAAKLSARVGHIDGPRKSFSISSSEISEPSNGVLYGDNLLPEGAPPTDQEAQIESLERRLRQQQFESERDGKWLAEEETNLVLFDPPFSLLLRHLFYILFPRFQFAEKTTLRRSQLIRQRLSRRPKFVHATVETFRLIGSFLVLKTPKNVSSSPRYLYLNH